MTMTRWFKRSREQEQRDELLSAYLDGQLAAEERARLEAQLATDPALRTELEALRRTVALVRNLPRVPAPRNFVLPQTIAIRPRPVPAVRSRRALAPLFTVATSIAALLFIAVLVGDLWSATIGPRLALAPAAAPAPPEEEWAGVATVSVEQQDMGTSATAPALALGASTEDAAETDKGGPSTGVPPATPPLAFAAPVAEGSPPASSPTAEPAAPEEAAALPSPSPVPTIAVDAYGLGERREGMRAPVEQPAREAAATSRPLPSWRLLEIALGLAVLVLGAGTIWAWRARRR